MKGFIENPVDYILLASLVVTIAIFAALIMDASSENQHDHDETRVKDFIDNCAGTFVQISSPYEATRYECHVTDGK